MFAAAATMCGAYGAVLTPQAALERALGNAPEGARKTLSVGQNPELAYTQATTTGQAALYVFTTTTGAGTMFVSADTDVEPLLGFSQETFEAAKMNSNLRYWLNEYARQIEYARTHNVEAKAINRAYRAPIEPMCDTRWNQSAPFNDDCPTYNGQRCVTGCVATAMAQVMKYHNYPEKGTGSKTYTSSTIGQSLTIDYANTTYDWANMLNVYDSDATATQNKAVANLMYSCGVAVDMNYTPSESGASSMEIAPAMINYFGYDKGLHYVPRDYYGLEDWENLVYENLSYGPIQYSGQNDEGGHSFVCDGYSSDGYFHINWGWGGMSDGYFLLTALDPTEQGIGGSTAGYNYGQDVVVGVQKPVEGSTIYEQIYAQGFSVTTSSASLGGRVQISGPMYSFSAGSISGTLGVKITASDGTVTYATGASFSNLNMGYGYNSYSITLPSTLGEGFYTVTPAFRTAKGVWQDIPVILTANQEAEMEVAGNTAYFANEGAPQLSVTNVSYDTPFYLNNKYKITATVTNTGDSEYYGTILLGLAASNTATSLCAVGPDYAIDLQAGESTDITYIGEFTSSQISAGTYYAAFFTSNYEQLSELQEITINDASDAVVSITTPVITDSEGVDATNFTATTDVTVTSGYLGGALTLAIFPYDTTGGNVSAVCTLTSPELFMSPTDGTKTVTFSGQLSNVEEGKQYFAAVFNGSSNMLSKAYAYFTVKTTTGATDLAVDAAQPEKVTYYNINGAEVGEPSAMPGVYIIKATDATGKVTTSKVVIR